jgi:Lipase (class 3)
MIILLNLGVITTQQLNYLDEISKFAGIAYCTDLSAPFSCSSWCSDFNNITLVLVLVSLSNLTKKFTTTDFTEIVGYVARDDSEKRIIVAIRGTSSLPNTLVDALTFLSPTGLIPECATCRVHSGFYMAWKSVENVIDNTVIKQVVDYPEYQLLVTGHSLGGAVAALLVIPINNISNDRVYHIKIG